MWESVSLMWTANLSVHSRIRFNTPHCLIPCGIQSDMHIQYTATGCSRHWSVASGGGAAKGGLCQAWAECLALIRLCVYEVRLFFLALRPGSWSSSIYHIMYFLFHLCVFGSSGWVCVLGPYSTAKPDPSLGSDVDLFWLAQITIALLRQLTSIISGNDDF